MVNPSLTARKSPQEQVLEGGVGLGGDRNRDDPGVGHQEHEGAGGDAVQGEQVSRGLGHHGGPPLGEERPEMYRNRADPGAGHLEQPRRLSLSLMRDRAAAKEQLDKAAAREALEKKQKEKSLKRRRKITIKITKNISLTGTDSQQVPRNRKRKLEQLGDGDSEAVQARKLSRNSEGSERVSKNCNKSKITNLFNTRVADQSVAGGVAELEDGGGDDLGQLGPGLVPTRSANTSNISAVPAASAKNFSPSNTLAETQLLGRHNSAGQ